MTQPWGYGPSNGPSHWGELAPAALGQHQSPVNIHSAAAEYSRELADHPLKIIYQTKDCESIVNTGRSVQVHVNSNSTNLTGGPLGNDEYVLKQFHFHWGNCSDHGSEHTVDGVIYSAELHLVHWNRTQFGSFEEAAKEPNGLTVLAVFLQASDTQHLGLKNLVGYFDKIVFADEPTKLDTGYDPSSILPEDTSRYWTYCGSLTTPPCYESVRFIIFKDAIHVSEDQLNSFRALKSVTRNNSSSGDSCCRLVDNFRPVMPLNDRVITASFRKFFA